MNGETLAEYMPDLEERFKITEYMLDVVEKLKNDLTTETDKRIIIRQRKRIAEILDFIENGKLI